MMEELRRWIPLLPSVRVFSCDYQESAGQLRRYKCQKLPQYIVLHFRRFTKNMFVEEKKPDNRQLPAPRFGFRRL